MISAKFLVAVMTVEGEEKEGTRATCKSTAEALRQIWDAQTAKPDG